MSNINEVQRIVKKHIPDDIWEMPPKLGWFNQCLFRKKDVDQHTVAIKMGQAMELIYMDVAKLRYPGKLMPRSLAGFGVDEGEAEQYFTDKYENGQSSERKNAIIILTRLDAVKTAETLAGETQKYLSVPRKKRVRFNHEIMSDLSDRSLKSIPLQKEIREVCVDLCPLMSDAWTLLEVKMSGNVDGGKTKQVFIDNMLSPFVCLGNKPKHVYYGIITNNLGVTEDGEWKGQLKGIVSPEMILVEEKLFDLIAPNDVTFDDFTSMICKRVNHLRP